MIDENFHQFYFDKFCWSCNSCLSWNTSLKLFSRSNPAGSYLFKHHVWSMFKSVQYMKYESLWLKSEQISHIVLVFPLHTMNKWMSTGKGCYQIFRTATVFLFSLYCKASLCWNLVGDLMSKIVISSGVKKCFWNGLDVKILKIILGP